MGWLHGYVRSQTNSSNSPLWILQISVCILYFKRKLKRKLAWCKVILLVNVIAVKLLLTGKALGLSLDGDDGEMKKKRKKEEQGKDKKDMVGRPPRCPQPMISASLCPCPCVTLSP